MADNTTAPNSDVFAADDIGGVKYPKAKLVYGPNDTAVDVTSTTPLPVIDQGAQSWADINPNDATVLNPIPRALYFGGAGNVVLTGADNVDATFAVSAGQTLACRAKKVKATGTTATGIVGLNG